jgi:hypothetical protein
MSKDKFKKQVLESCDGICENPFCDADATTVHHFLKKSSYPEYKFDPDNGMGACGSCHAEIERRIRNKENWWEIIPISRYNKMMEKENVKRNRL